MSLVLHQVYLGLGSNIEPHKNLGTLLKVLENQFGTLQYSTVYQTKAVGFVGDDFINLVVGFKTHYTPEQLVEYLKQIEQQLGRINQQGFTARTVDADLLLYEGTQIAHKDIERYPFVLYPLAELASDWLHPTRLMTLSTLAQQLNLSRDDMQAIAFNCSFE
jgi:2-amino-4-hydroxy-6-hydroxymethyldihydropteridine diphosphokinase